MIANAQKVTVENKPKLTDSLKIKIEVIDKYINSVDENKTLQKQGTDSELTAGGNYEDYYYVEVANKDTIEEQQNLINTKSDHYLKRYFKNKLVVCEKNVTQNGIDTITTKTYYYNNHIIFVRTITRLNKY